MQQLLGHLEDLSGAFQLGLFSLIQAYFSIR
jgi:hypothetical protein